MRKILLKFRYLSYFIGLIAIFGILTSIAMIAKNQSTLQVTAIIGGTIIDGTGRSPIKNGVIIIQGNKIVDIKKEGQTELPKNAHVIDTTGKYIIPGLMDANTHLCLLHDWKPEIIARYEGRFEELIEEAAQVALKYGNTTVFDTWGSSPAPHEC